MKNIKLNLIVIILVVFTFVSCNNKPKVIMDTRDGKTYNTVRIGDQLWLTENLNYEDPNAIHYNISNYKQSIINGFNKQFGNYPKSWTYYTYDIAVKACPEGCHIPSVDEWNKLIDEVKKQGKQDTAVMFGGSLKLDFFPLYYYNPFYAENSKINSLNAIQMGNKFGEEGLYWTSSESEPGVRQIVIIDKDGEIQFNPMKETNLGLSVRCIKD